MCPQYGELRPTSGWDRFGSLGHPSYFQRLPGLGSVTAWHVVVGVRGRHLCSAGRPSGCLWWNTEQILAPTENFVYTPWHFSDSIKAITVKIKTPQLFAKTDPHRVLQLLYFLIRRQNSQLACFWKQISGPNLGTLRLTDWLSCGYMSHSTQNRSFWRRSPSQSLGLVWKN